MHVLAAALAFVLGGHGSAAHFSQSLTGHDIPTLRLRAGDRASDPWGDTALVQRPPEAGAWFNPGGSGLGLSARPTKHIEVGAGGFLKGFGPSVNYVTKSKVKIGVGVYVEKPMPNQPIATEFLAGVKFPMPF
jgi:hypothetical protein